MDDSDLVTPKISRARPKTVITFSSDEEEEEEEGEMAVQSAYLLIICKNLYTRMVCVI